MSLRRSTRLSTLSGLELNRANEIVAGVSSGSRKRRHCGKDTRTDATTSLAADRPTGTMGPPITPNKRKRTMKLQPAAPVTPTPSAVGLMLGSKSSTRNYAYSTGDIDDATPPPTRPAEPHYTNAILTTPGGNQVTAKPHEFEDSPSKAGTKTTTNKTLLANACDHLCRTDPKLKAVVAAHQCRIFSPEGLAETIDPFRSLASGIISQQVSGAAAKSIKNKFVALFPLESCPSGFPSAALVASTPIPRLREAGLSQRKAEYIQGLAEKFDSGELSVQMLMNGSDEQVMEKLVAVRGLGKWSCEMFLCFGLKRMDVLSTGDLGVQRGMAAYVGRDVAKLKAKGGGKWKYMSEQDMLGISEKFRPYRSLFMWYMWRIEVRHASAGG